MDENREKFLKSVKRLSKKIVPDYFIGDVVEGIGNVEVPSQLSTRNGNKIRHFRSDYTLSDPDMEVMRKACAVHLLMHKHIDQSEQNCRKIDDLLASKYKKYENVLRRNNVEMTCYDVDEQKKEEGKGEGDGKSEEEENEGKGEGSNGEGDVEEIEGNKGDGECSQGEGESEDEQDDEGNTDECEGEGEGKEGKCEGEGDEGEIGSSEGEDKKAMLVRLAAQQALDEAFEELSFKMFLPISNKFGKMISKGNIPTYNPPNRRDFNGIIVPGRKGYKKACVMLDTSTSIPASVIKNMTRAISVLPFQYDLILFSTNARKIDNMRGRGICDEEIERGVTNFFKVKDVMKGDYSSFLILSDFYFMGRCYKFLNEFKRRNTSLVMFVSGKNESDAKNVADWLECRLKRNTHFSLDFRMGDFLILNDKTTGKIYQIKGGEEE